MFGIPRKKNYGRGGGLHKIHKKNLRSKPKSPQAIAARLKSLDASVSNSICRIKNIRIFIIRIGKNYGTASRNINIYIVYNK